MKILFFTRLFWPHIGGIEKHLERISEILVKDGHEITIITTKHETKLKDKEVYKKIKIIRFTQPPIKYFGLISTWIYLIRNIGLIKGSDIVHIHDVFIWYWPFKILLPFKKVFLTYHGRWGQYPIPYSDLIQKRMGAKMSDGLICVGDYLMKSYGIKCNLVTYGATKIPQKHNNKNSNLAIYVGRLDADIAFEKILFTLKKVKKHKLVIFCGDGDLSSKAKLIGEVKGFVNPRPYFQKAKYVFASGYLTILEALASKCLIFRTYENSLQKDYFEMTPFKKYFITSINPDVLYKKFTYYESHPKEAEKIIEEGYNWVKTQTWENLVSKYYKLWGIKAS